MVEQVSLTELTEQIYNQFFLLTKEFLINICAAEFGLLLAFIVTWK